MSMSVYTLRIGMWSGAVIAIPEALAHGFWQGCPGAPVFMGMAPHYGSWTCKVYL